MRCCAATDSWTRRDEDPLVRTVRRPATDVESGLILTLYGKVLRHGPGWWINQPEGVSKEHQAIAAQLRTIEATDPAQSLHGRGGPRPADTGPPSFPTAQGPQE